MAKAIFEEQEETINCTTPKNQTIKNNLLFLKKLKFAEADYLRICA